MVLRRGNGKMTVSTIDGILSEKFALGWTYQDITTYLVDFYGADTVVLAHYITRYLNRRKQRNQ